MDSWISSAVAVTGWRGRVDELDNSGDDVVGLEGTPRGVLSPLVNPRDVYSCPSPQRPTSPPPPQPLLPSAVAASAVAASAIAASAVAASDVAASAVTSSPIAESVPAVSSADSE